MAYDGQTVLGYYQLITLTAPQKKIDHSHYWHPHMEFAMICVDDMTHNYHHNGRHIQPTKHMVDQSTTPGPVPS
jgi:hypothetical protein